MIVRGVLGMMAVLALAGCGSGNNTAAESSPPSSTPSSGTPSVTSTPTATPTATPSTPPKPTPTLTAKPTPQPTPEPTAFPTAANGRNYAACTDGKCEVLIRKSARLTVLGEKLSITVAQSRVRISTRRSDGSGSDMSFGVVGSASWGHVNGPMTKATLTAANGSTAILKLTTTR